MTKGIRFIIIEQKDTEEEIIEQGVHNGFGKIQNLPPIKYIRKKPVGFNPKELGELFIEIGNKLKTINNNITDVKAESILKESAHAMGKELIFDVTFREIEKKEKENERN